MPAAPGKPEGRGAAKQTGDLKSAVLIGAGRMGAAMARGWLRGLKGAGIAKFALNIQKEAKPTAAP